MKTMIRFVLALAFASVAFSFTAPRAEAHDQFEMLGELQYLLKYSMIQAAIAKEICSCRYIAGLTLDQCEGHMGLAADALMFVNVTEQNGQIAVGAAQGPMTPEYSPTSVATFDSRNPRLGCHLSYGMVDALTASGTPMRAPMH